MRSSRQTPVPLTPTPHATRAVPPTTSQPEQSFRFSLQWDLLLAPNLDYTDIFFAGPPYHYGATAAGVLGRAGIAGALGAPIIGRISDRRGPRLADLIALTLGLIAFALLLVAGRHLAGLIGGILPLDLATQANLVSNQTRIYSLLQDAANRLNTIYMSSYPAGGAAIGSLASQHFGWTGLCGLGLALFATTLAVLARSNTSTVIQSALTRRT